MSKTEQTCGCGLTFSACGELICAAVPYVQHDFGPPLPESILRKSQFRTYKLSCFMAQREDDKMRRELRAPEGAEALTYSFHFQISNKGGRQDCNVEVLAPNVEDATMYFRQTLPHFESIA